MPPHVTVLFPFGTPEALGDGGIARLSASVRTVPTFSTHFVEVSWFGDEIAWLRAADDAPFLRLIHSVHASFPEYPPYGGAHDDIQPHLTIGTSTVVGSARLRGAAEAISARLPLQAMVTEVQYGVVTDEPGSWSLRHRIPLGPVA